ncbi:hypothetical protein O3G_MSEX000395, partial [Manduca sexta]
VSLTSVPASVRAGRRTQVNTASRPGHGEAVLCAYTGGRPGRRGAADEGALHHPGAGLAEGGEDQRPALLAHHIPEGSQLGSVEVCRLCLCLVISEV